MQKAAFIAAVAGAAGFAVAAPSSFIDLGVVGTPGSYTFDTFGSELVQDAFGDDVPRDADTEIALYDAGGVVLAENDDAGGTLLSEISLNLSAGVYFVAVGEFNSIWEPNFVNSGTSFEDGDIAEIDVNLNGSLVDEVTMGFDSATGFENQTQFWRLEVVPTPGAAGLLGLAGLAAVRRRR